MANIVIVVPWVDIIGADIRLCQRFFNDDIYTASLFLVFSNVHMDNF